VSEIDLSDLFVRPVTGHPDVFAFQFDFLPEGKALDDGTIAPLITELDNGDLLIDGYAAVFEGDDREGENFADASTLEHGIKSFLNGQAGLCYHHKHDKLLGKVLHLGREEGKGMRMKARVDGAIRSHPELKTYYEQIKNGSLNALSIGGFFKRGIGALANKIVGVDFTEISVTPVPVHPGTSFAVVAGKALQDVTVTEEPDAKAVQQMEDMVSELDQILANLTEAVNKRTGGSSVTTN
jgi:HK97 family phage prohead protease